MPTNYFDLVQQYGDSNVKILGDKVLAYDGYNTIIGYTIDRWKNIHLPDTLKDKIYTDISNTGRDWNKAYDFLWDTPDGTILPDFSLGLLNEK